MLTKDDLLAIGSLIEGKLKPIKEQLDTVELKVEAIHAQNKKDQAEIMDKLATSNVTNSDDLKKLDERVTVIEKQLHRH